MQRVSYNGYYNSLPSYGWGFDSPYPLHLTNTPKGVFVLSKDTTHFTCVLLHFVVI
ncbi:MAG: hypothetical protein ACD_81C00184G0002 [uncultured bacterium]|uniref:Uncharacterized protein n=2 Tax=Candidatus Wolfeibacteriota TaxID=1752735 RepID=A0A0G1JEY8_9BACT|nr:MAG: hypothetical protein ACD_81C00184G0002 [uncultured bacterium]KKR12202.1 MAG: hypothetical protein UT41_C0003G0129 [Candidatus Wolfebacteria bacterium GW2011_GWC2_39_22]KKT42577.1 MAG: hypothetical protein UW32_C0005G0013 [Candidatus Wolfebacteria bacterium GW2011_GWE2_44_13]